MNTPDVLLFDLGGGLVEFSGIEGRRRLHRTDVDEQVVRQRFTASPLVRQLGVGAIEPLAFAEAFVAEWDLTVPPAAFLAEFRSWSRGLLPGARELFDVEAAPA